MADLADTPRIKGSSVLLTVKALKSQRKKAMALLDADLHAYFERRILPSDWYSEPDHQRLIGVLGRLHPQLRRTRSQPSGRDENTTVSQILRSEHDGADE
jgi:hypothetical protein